MLPKNTANNIPQNIINKLKESKNIIILPHVSVDGDALGSSLALALALKKAGKNVRVYFEEEIPQVFTFLPGKEFILKYSNFNEDSSKMSKAETVVALDTGDLERLGNRVEIFNNSENKINIDHHPTNTYFAEINYVNPKAAATCEIVYELIKAIDIELDNDIALCLYTGILTDTGGFKFGNTTSITHLIVSDLLNYQLDIPTISYRIFDAVSKEKLKLIGKAINTIELHEDGKLALATVTKKMLEETGALDEDTEGIINYVRNINGVEIAALFKEKEDLEIKVSLRSKSYADVAEIALKHNGGGHKNAAGCTINAPLGEAKKIIFDDLIKAINTHKS